MEVIYTLIPMMLIFGFLVVIVFIWMAKAGHFDDMDGAANRIFMDDEYPEDLGPEKTAEKPSETQLEMNESQPASSPQKNKVDSNYIKEKKSD